MSVTDRRGISLFESLMAVTIVSMTAVGAFEVIGAQFRLAERSRRALEAEALATERLDVIGLLPNSQLLSLPDSIEKGTFDYPMNEYSWETTSTPYDQLPGVYDVVLHILWPGNAYTVHTLMYRRPTVRTVN